MVSIPYIHVTRYHFLSDLFVLLLLMNVGQLNLVPRKIKKVLKTKKTNYMTAAFQRSIVDGLAAVLLKVTGEMQACLKQASDRLFSGGPMAQQVFTVNSEKIALV